MTDAPTSPSASGRPESLVRAWGRAYYEAARAGTSTVFVEVDGEDANAATLRWIQMIADAHGLSAAGRFGGIANTVLAAQAALGRTEREHRPRLGRRRSAAVTEARSDVAEALAALDNWQDTLEALESVREVNPGLYAELERGAERAQDLPASSALHAHEITPADAAMIRTLAGAVATDQDTFVLPSGKVIDGAELTRWLRALEQ